MRRALLCILAITALAAPAAAQAAPKVQMMVVGAHKTLLGAREVRLASERVAIGHRRCSVPAGTALAGLLAARLPVRVTDLAGCDPASMFVAGIRGESNRGAAGWEYKVGHAAPSFSAADPGGKLRPGAQLLWYWCTRASDCQRTLAVTTRVSGTATQFHVVGYDDNGHGRAVAGATVHVGTRTAVTNAHGWARLTLTVGRYQLYATKAGMVRSFPSTVGIVA